MKKTILLLCSLSMALVAACGNDAVTDNEQNNDGSSEAAVTTTLPPAETEPVTTTEDPEKHIFIDVNDSVYFESLKDFENYIDKTGHNNNYAYPEYDKEKYHFDSAQAYEGSGVFYLLLKDDEGNYVSFSSQISGTVCGSFDRLCEINRTNITLDFKTVEAPELNGLFNSDPMNFNDFYFLGINDDGRKYTIALYKTDESDTSIDELKEILKDFKV